ncbi:expressed unknown protein [Seminavis robusta]|uniref:Uncharacterized protein n=1 Tax=Seminavis robusta TaxID=568900 RepID=A0A9N8EHR6_9STRA|nr:expressed unknown protein [Seminavis robusta]|eukprot:Sro954_g224350.1 n/a (486) ;mRNA; r:26112-27657
MTFEIPDVVEFVPCERTYLCRWDAGEDFDDGVSEVSSGSGSSSDDDDESSSEFEEAPTFRHSDTTPVNFRYGGGKNDKFRNSDTTGTTGTTGNTARVSSPPSKPKRCFTPEMNGDRWGNIKSGKKALNCKKVSQQSGVNIKDIMLQPIEFSDLKPVPKSNYTLPLADILKHSTATEKSAKRLQVEPERSNTVTAVFCIRRAGCGMCRDHGLSLSTQLKPKLHEKDIELNLFGIVKDLDGSGEGDETEHRRDRKDKKISSKILIDFYKNYFPFPLYTDKNWDTFQFLGDRKMSMWKLFQRSTTVLQRYHRKKITNIINDPRGDPLTQGGVLLFDANGQLRYVYYERYGDELDLQALQWAAEDIAKNTKINNNNIKSNAEPATAPRLPRRRGTFDKGLLEGAIHGRKGSNHTKGSINKNNKKGDTPLQSTGIRKPQRRGTITPPNGPRKPQRRGTIDDAEKAYDLHALNLAFMDDCTTTSRTDLMCG